MIFEIRTYNLQMGSLGEVEKRFGEAYEKRKEFSPLAGFFHTEIGPLNQIVHVWPYQDLAERARIRGEAVAAGVWPPKIQDFITAQDVEVLMPFPFLESPAPSGSFGPLYELRYYTYRPGMLPEITESWRQAVPGRTQLSPMWLAGSIDIGEANRLIHIWPYASLNDRAETRRKAVETGVWPPKGGAQQFITQANKILVPSSFSPAQ